MRLARTLPLLLAMATAAHGADRASELVDSEIRDTQHTRSAEDKAAEWGLDSKEWKRYEQLMDGPRGIQSPGLDPVSVLGIEARSDEERIHFARIQARMERERVQKELLYQRAYDEAIGQLNQGEQVVNLQPEKPMFSSSEAGLSSATGSGRLALFVSSDCGPCVSRAKTLQQSKTPFDIYVVGSDGDDSLVRQWARGAGIDPARVRSREITINHDEGRWAALRDGSDVDIGGDLPLALKLIDGNWVVQ